MAEDAREERVAADGHPGCEAQDGSQVVNKVVKLKLPLPRKLLKVVFMPPRQRMVERLQTTSLQDAFTQASWEEFARENA